MVSTEWRMIVDGPRSALEQMRLDDRLAREALPTVRIYGWGAPAFSLGWKQPWPAWLAALGSDPSRTPLSQTGSDPGFAVVERPTGGGVAVHGSDCSIAVVIPQAWGIPLEAIMRIVCGRAADLCRGQGAEARLWLDAPAGGRITYCLTEPSAYAVLIGERKVAGFALRRYQTSWLIQGSLLVRPMPRVLEDAMPPGVRRQFETRAIPLASVATAPIDDRALAGQWGEGWPSWWDEQLAETTEPALSGARGA
jgi:lipoate-protein ligase A